MSSNRVEGTFGMFKQWGTRDGNKTMGTNVRLYELYYSEYFCRKNFLSRDISGDFFRLIFITLFTAQQNWMPRTPQIGFKRGNLREFSRIISKHKFRGAVWKYLTVWKGIDSKYSQWISKEDLPPWMFCRFRNFE